MNKNYLIALILSTVTLCANGSQGFSIGAGAIASKTVYKDMEDKIKPIPVIDYNSNSLYIKSTQIGYKAFNSNDININLFVEARLDGYDSGDSDYFKGMEDRKDSIDGGIEISKSLPYRFQTSLDFKHDILNEHKGFESSLKLSYFYGDNIGMLIPSVGISYLSDKLANYYYGVRIDETTQNRNYYEVGQAYAPFVSLSSMYNFNENWRAILVLKATAYSSEIEDSPIVDNNIKYTGVFGISYRF